jgi:hypothetical protein
MHYAGSHSVADDEHRVDQAILTMLLADDSSLWTVAEVIAEIGNAIEVADSLSRLHRVGLVNRVDVAVVASRSARRAAALLE